LVSTYHRKQPKVFWFVSVILLLLVLTSVGTVLFIEDESLRRVISDVSSPLYNLIATIALIFAAKQSRRISRRVALGWGILALAQFSFTVGDILWAVLEVGLNSTPFPSIADGPYLLFYPLFFIGITILPSRQVNRSEWIKRTLDLSIVMIAAALGFWIFLIGPIVGTESTTPFMETFLNTAYTVGDLILLFALLIIAYYQSEKYISGSIWLLVSGTIVMIVTDSIYSYQSLSGTFVSGSALDFGWIFSYILFAFAGIHQGVIAQTHNEDAPVSPKRLVIRQRISQILAFMPYLWVVAAFFLLANYHDSELPINSDVLFIGVGGMIGFVLIRQIIALRENNLLLANLRKSVEQGDRQAADLNKMNQSLQKEIIRRERVEEQLSHDALHDGLTGLANRILLMDRLGHAVEVSKRELDFHYSIMFLDIDNFKSVNDGLGHSAGDQALVEMALRLKSCTRSIDTVSRFGGDEFVILLEYTPDDDHTSLIVANRILTELKRPYLLKGKEILISCSMGIVQGISDYSNPEDILRDVDIALYRAKKRGKARYEIFNLDMRTWTISRLEIEADLRRGIANRELYLDYQPIYSLNDNQVEGLEALVRWRHPQRGLIMPSEFIEIAEESDLIIQMGDWVLHEACAQLKKWHNEYPELGYLSVNVNISGKQINQKDFVHKVQSTLNETGLNPKRLILEITENAFIENQLLIDELLSDLRKTGVAFAIDDFGTGYSSLGYLQNFSVNTIKIDKSFVDEIDNGKKGYEIIKTIILMAQGMGMNTVAEGIENDDQLQNLKSLMCKSGQGFYLSKPVDVGLLETILKNQAIQAARVGL
jgi:diguanylate cyclase (GGDEF)-like protein